ncbi:MAG TPA: non-canonical purine NTP pyrophosphatase, partial [Microthrixaceae bacterium]|nr:non-canonical purine NTP pyrophosphatase [Microthrixaceae bacterium]
MADQQRRVVLASNNPHKAAEFAELLAEHLPLWEPLPRPPEVPEVIEDAPTFLGNARLKAAALVEATGDSALADDSGLVVDHLGGRPGVLSARFAGEGATDADNVARLLEELAAHGATEPDSRTARFVCVLVLRHPDGTEVVAEGSVEGTIAMEPRGHRGFGYDPVFLPTEGFGRSFAEMSESE